VSAASRGRRARRAKLEAAIQERPKEPEVYVRRKRMTVLEEWQFMSDIHAMPILLPREPK
jgi:hypothetical protein